MTHNKRYRLACLGAFLLYVGMGAFVAFFLLLLGSALDRL